MIFRFNMGRIRDILFTLILLIACPFLSAQTSGGGSGGVTSINSNGGAFTFSGSGVSCTGTTCTFSAGGSGNTTSTSLTTNILPKANGANSIINSLLSDNGTILIYTGTGGSVTPQIQTGASNQAQIAASSGGGGYSNFTLNGNNTDTNRLGFVGGGTGDSNLYFDLPSTSGQYNFRFNSNASSSSINQFGFSGNSVSVNHFISAGSTPTVVFGTGAGSTPTATSITGHDAAFTVNFTSGVTPAASNPIFTVTFSTVYGSAPNCTFASHSASSAIASLSVYYTSTTSTFILNSNATALTTGLAYSWTVNCIQ